MVPSSSVSGSVPGKFVLFAAVLLCIPTLGPAGAAAKPRVILVGWDGADWKLLDPLIQEGRLPNLAALVAKGRTWNLTTYQPMASPLIWTTMATGRNPVDHGVNDFQEYDPKTRVRLPISGRSRKVPAIWNLASVKGVTVGVVGWWATWPAEKVKGFLVSDRAAPVLFDPEALSKSPALAWPESLAEGVRLVGKREGTPPFEDVAKALNVARAEFDAAVAEGKDLSNPITGYRKILGVTRVIGKIAVDLYDREKPELLMVYFEGTDEIGHVLGRFYPPKLPTVSGEDFQKFKGGVAAFYAEADRILGELMTRAERDGATLLLASDHGFKWGDDRPRYYSGVQFDTAFLWHSSPGILAGFGPGILPAPKRGEAGVFDVTPTLCRLLGLPPDPAFEGKLISGVGGPSVPRSAPAVSWAKIASIERLVVAPGSEDRKAADEFTKKLISLGYLTGSEASAVDARPPARAGTETAGSFQNVGTFLRSRGRVADSVGWYRKALDVNPRSPTAWMNLSLALYQLGKWDESDDALLSAIANGYNDPEATVYRQVAAYAAKGQKTPSARAQLVSFMKKVVSAAPANDRYRASLGKALFENRDCAGAQAIFQELVPRTPRDFENLNLLALTNWCLGRVAEAREAFERSLAVNSDQPVVREGLIELARGVPGPVIDPVFRIRVRQAE